MKFEYLQVISFLTFCLYIIVNMIKVSAVNKIIRSDLNPINVFDGMINLFFMCKIFYVIFKNFYIKILEFFYVYLSAIFINNLNFIWIKYIPFYIYYIIFIFSLILNKMLICNFHYSTFSTDGSFQLPQRIYYTITYSLKVLAIY